MNKLLLYTRKGLIEYAFEGQKWIQKHVHFKAVPVTFTYVDDRNGWWWACLDHGHWGVKLSVSKDNGVTWEEMQPPKYPEGTEVKEGVLAKTEYIWSIASGGKDHPGHLWMGTIPGGLFKSEDYGQTWELNSSLWDHPSRV